MKSINTNDVTAAILIGGRGRRMGGQDKSTLVLTHNNKKQTFLNRILEELKPLNLKTVLAGRSEQSHPHFPLIQDYQQDCGPLGALYSVMRECDTNWVLLIACDVPAIKTEVLQAILDQATTASSLILPTTGKFNHPTVALYNRSLLPVLRLQLDNKHYSFRSLFDVLDKQSVIHWRVPDKWTAAFHNINRPADLKLV